MDGMVINNLSAQATTECGLLQQELLKSFVEARKQRGITESLIQRLAEKKIYAIRDMYKNVHVTHNKYGECNCFFHIETFDDEFTLALKYYVKKIPLVGLSKHDKSVARRYNEYVYSTIVLIMFHLILRHFDLVVVLQVFAIGVTLLMIFSKAIS